MPRPRAHPRPHERAPGGDDVAQRLRRHLEFLGLTHTLAELERLLAWATLYNLIDRRHGRATTAVTSNIALSDWGRYLGDATLTAAILDRLAMHAIRIDVDGPSYRQHVAKTRADGRTAKV